MDKKYKEYIFNFLNRIRTKEKQSYNEMSRYYDLNNSSMDCEQKCEIECDMELAKELVALSQQMLDYIESIENIDTIKWGDELQSIELYTFIEEDIDSNTKLRVFSTQDNDGISIGYYLLTKNDVFILSHTESIKDTIDLHLIEKAEYILKKLAIEGYIRKVTK